MSIMSCVQYTTDNVFFCLEIDEDRLPNQLYKVIEYEKVHFYLNNITPVEMWLSFPF